MSRPGSSLSSRPALNKGKPGKYQVSDSESEEEDSDDYESEDSFIDDDEDAADEYIARAQVRQLMMAPRQKLKQQWESKFKRKRPMVIDDDDDIMEAGLDEIEEEEEESYAFPFHFSAITFNSISNLILK
jgi:hypothetical protein